MRDTPPKHRRGPRPDRARRLALVRALGDLERAVRALHPRAQSATLIIDFGGEEREPRAVPVFAPGLSTLDDDPWDDAPAGPPLAPAPAA